MLMAARGGKEIYADVPCGQSDSWPMHHCPETDAGMHSVQDVLAEWTPPSARCNRRGVMGKRSLGTSHRRKGDHSLVVGYGLKREITSEQKMFDARERCWGDSDPPARHPRV